MREETAMLRLLIKSPLTLVALLAISLALPAFSAPVDDADRQTMSLPGLGTNGRLDCDDLVYQSRTQTFRAIGNVVFRSDEYNIDAGEIIFDEVNSSLFATGDHVQFEIGNMVAISSALEYNPETGGLTLNRRNEDDPQPCVLEERPDSIFTAYADTITIENDENGDPIIHLDGNVRTLSTPRDDADESAMTGASENGVFGTGATIECASLVYHLAGGAMDALGSVVLDTGDVTIASDILNYSEANDRLTATGELVEVNRDDVEAVCTLFTYHLSSGRMILDRHRSWDDQPEVWQMREKDVFHARADQIFMNERESGGTTVDWSRNTLIELYPVAADEETPVIEETGAPVRIDSLDQIPNLIIDPFA